ncbi:uncharacterized protein [Watersipora subatra]|uniref:uncharacterized protein n=1 Tax=Watersipora subatra TaxID=2589382 RepID=UPI00355BBEBA
MEKTSLTRNRKRDVEAQSKLLEQLYVHGVYEQIAPDFEQDQHRPWPDIKKFLMNLEPGSIVADVGCGNGHYLNVNPNITVIGIDRSSSLLDFANSRASGVSCRADCLNLPFRENAFDAILFVGVIHHLVTRQRQVKALNELSRILRPGGQILLYAWAWEQEKRKFESQNLLIPRHVSAGSNVYVSNSIRSCSCWDNGEKTNESKALSKWRQLLQKVVVKRLYNRYDSLESCRSSSSDSLQSSDNDEYISQQDISDEIIEIPEEFKVREFPASSLFSTATTSKQHQIRAHRRSCAAHSAPYDIHSRHDRFYHVFKRGELEKLIGSDTRNLEVIKSFYTSGYWCTTLHKTSQ